MLLIGEKGRGQNISCCSVANSDTDGSGEKKYFLTDESILVLYNGFLIFYSFCQSGDATFTITATKTVCN